MSTGLKNMIDAAAGGALLFALLMVFLVDRFVFSRPHAAPSANTLDVTVIDAGNKEGKRLRLAVTPTGIDQNPFTKQFEKWDDMGKLLLELGEGYKFDKVTPQEILQNPKLLKNYDVLFFTCAPEGEELKERLRDYVADGGILYASDWRYDAVAAAFPDVVDPKTRANGAGQKLEAEIVDPALRELLGKTIDLKFELGDWKTAAFAGPSVKTLIRGKYLKMPAMKGTRPTETAIAPLMVKFTFHKGTVIFTSFHNEKQNSEKEKKLLQYLVFSLVTASTDSDVNNKMEKDQFTPQRSNLLSTPRDDPKVTKTHELKRAGTLRFALGIPYDGAELSFHIKSPDNKEFTWKGKSTVNLEVPNAMAGTWTYTVTALHLPYDNFPFTVTVGEKK